MVPNLAFKFSYTMVHLFHRKKDGVWFMMDSVHHGEPDLHLKMEKLKRNAIQLGEANLATLLVLPTNEISCRNMIIGQKPGRLTPKKVRRYLDQISKESTSDSSYDWFFEDGKLHFAVIPSETMEKAIEFSEKHGFKPSLAVGIPQSKEYGKAAIFKVISSKNADLSDLKQSPLEFEMEAVKLPKSASRDSQTIY
ncbi:MAG: hypothetical protein OXC82_03980 [Rhodobacteraceae bacterium]|nr:hypothetical protein [Paracoccaceae bacterium]MCY4249580.1 hypothetical protein [Paracoccaceae bacterium]